MRFATWQNIFALSRRLRPLMAEKGPLSGPLKKVKEGLNDVCLATRMGAFRGLHCGSKPFAFDLNAGFLGSTNDFGGVCDVKWV